MSSESSVSTSDSSRMRQFGLYRTIDARTEEFLRQSKRRQIKQGCLCATISTVITVTVVITVVVIYMKSGTNKDSNRTIAKASWIGLLNDSLSPFEEKLKKLNLDPSTITFLPLLIEAFKRNRYLEKLLEDYSSSSTTYEGKPTTEYPFEKNIFSNTKTWIKNPTSRLYAIEYKTAPIVYFKKPTAKLSYISKLRKIRDYKKVLLHVDNIMTDKVHKDTPAHISDKSKTQEPLKLVSTSKKKTKSQYINKSSQTTQKTLEQKNAPNCKCQTKELGIILNKLFSIIQKIIPDNAPAYEDNIQSSTEVDSESNVDINQTNFTKKKNNPSIHMSEFNNVFEEKNKDNSEEKEPNTASKIFSLYSEGYKDFSNLNNKEVELKDTHEVIVKKPETWEKSKCEENNTAETINDNLEYSEFSKNDELYVNPISLNIKNAGTTLKSIGDAISDFDVHSLELLKSKMIPIDKRLKDNEHLINKLPNTSSLTNGRKKSVSYSQTEKVLYDKPLDLENDYVFKSISLPLTLNLEKPMKNKGLKTMIKSMKSYLEAEKKNDPPNAKLLMKEYEETNKSSDNYVIYRKKSPESLISDVSVSNGTVVDIGNKIKNHREDFWSFLNSDYDRSKMRSMVPISRPTYLEIHRNNWNVKSSEDYDFNVKYNLFDLLSNK